MLVHLCLSIIVFSLSASVFFVFVVSLLFSFFFSDFLFLIFFLLKVICTKCNNVSNQFENMMDLTVEIHGDSASLEECLDQFTAKEWLHGDNMYKCDGYASSDMTHVSFLVYNLNLKSFSFVHCIPY